MADWMNVAINKWMSEWITDWLNENDWLTEWMNKWMIEMVPYLRRLNHGAIITHHSWTNSSNQLYYKKL